MRTLRHYTLLVCSAVVLSFATQILPALAQDLEVAPTTPEFVPTSPKEAWRDLEAVEVNDGTPWWAEVLLYIPNRVLDLIDVFRIDVGIGASVGGVVRVTKYAQGGYRQMLPVSLRV